MTDEEFRILVLRAVICVGIEDELGVRQLLLQDERVHGVDDHVLAAVHDQRWLVDRLEVVVRPIELNAPFAQGFELGECYLFVDLGVSVLFAQAEPLEEVAASRLACLRLGEMNGEPEVVGFFVGCAENLLRLGRQTGHTLAPARSGPDQDQLANKAGRMTGDLRRWRLRPFPRWKLALHLNCWRRRHC
jgi:hypothetical protein